MNTNPKDGRSETPINLLEPMEMDLVAGQPFDPAQYGQTETPMNLLHPLEIDFAVPYLVLTFRLAGEPVSGDTNLLALDLLALVDALSGYERSLGGRGLRLHGKEYADGAVVLALAPIAIDQAAGRLDDVKRLLTEIAGSVRPHDPGAPVLDAITELERSPADRCKVAAARRPWAVEARIAMPV